jgi:hypothetical protein
MYNDIKDLKIRMSTRGGGKIRRHESAYNPCERCKVLINYKHGSQGADTTTQEESYKDVASF